MIFSVPPGISIVGYSGPVVQDTELSLSCNITPGNPTTISILFWEFLPRYNETKSQALPAQRENQTLMIENTVYSDAGTYKCTAGNDLQTGTGEQEILIHCVFQFLNLIKLYC